MKVIFYLKVMICVSFILFVLGAGTTICSEFCYKNVWSNASSAGCALTGTIIGPGGFACYSAHHTGPGGCSYTTTSNSIRIGTQGGTSSGLSSFNIASDICYSYVECGPTLPYLWGDAWVWDCEVKSTSVLPSNGTWSAQHASGTSCP